ncbi:putative FAD-linked oxidoreductase, partial [Lachnellula suecica]
MSPSSLLFAGGLLVASLSFAQKVTVADLATGADCACTQLAAKYEILTSNSTNYTAEATNQWDIKSNLLPGCIYLPTNADEVADAVSIFVSCGAQFAIRGGGHMNFPGSNNINGGVLLALEKINTIEVASDNATVSVGPGNRWVDVYSALEPFGLYCIGGRMKTIGVPGLELIGGFHYLINKYGMAMDNVVSYDVVLGNGTQVIANSSSNPDLFWALKGGANNFGIVTKFTITTLAIPQISTTIQAFADEQAPAFIQATCDITNYDSGEIGAGSIISITYNTTTKTVTPSLLGVQEGTESPPSRFANFSAIPSLQTVNTVYKPLEWHSQLDSPFQQFRIQFVHHTIKPDAAQLTKIYNAWKLAVEDVIDVEGLLPTFVMNTLAASANTVAKNNGIGNTWGLDDDQGWILWQLATSWANAADDARMAS